MSLSKWKELADKKAITGAMKKNLFEDITEEKIRSKTTDQAIAKAFRLDRLDQIAEQTKPKPKIQIPRNNKEGIIDYAPDVDPYEDMNVEELLNLEDYTAPGVSIEKEKQIAKLPEYEMNPDYWNIDDPPPEYQSMLEEEPLAIEGPPDDDEFEDGVEEYYDYDEANRILDKLDLPNYNDIEMRLEEPEMTDAKKKKYLQKVIDNADTQRKRITVRKSNATKAYKAGKINLEQKNLIHEEASKIEKEIRDYRKHYESKLYSTKGSGFRRGQRGRGAYFFNDAKEMLQKLTLIIAEMQAGNTSIQMRNMGQTILDALLNANHLNKSQYRKLVKKYFAI